VHCAQRSLPPLAMRRSNSSSLLKRALRLRSVDTRLGRLLFPGLVLFGAAYVTFIFCDALAQAAQLSQHRAGEPDFGAFTPLVLDFADAAARTQPLSELTSRASVPAVPTIHVMATSNGSPYLNWQTRTMYKTFQMVQATPEGAHMKYFTRLLHRRTDDELVAEVPTLRVDSLHAACDTWCEFPVADRPHAVAAWLKTEDAQLGDYLFLIETDYVWLAPVPAPLAPGDKPLAFHYHYINPGYPGLESVISRMWPGGQQSLIPCTGPAPVLITHGDLVRLMPKWEEYAAWIENDSEAKDKLGWVREMYAYSIAAAQAGIVHEVQEPGSTVLISQPPADDSAGRASLFHYTWGAQFKNSSGGVVWEFDKRPFTETRHVRTMRAYIPSLPPQDAATRGLRLQDGKPVTEALLKVETQMLSRMRAAIEQLPDLNVACGWNGEPVCQWGCTQGVLCLPTGRTFKVEGDAR